MNTYLLQETEVLSLPLPPAPSPRFAALNMAAEEAGSDLDDLYGEDQPADAWQQLTTAESPASISPPTSSQLLLPSSARGWCGARRVNESHYRPAEPIGGRRSVALGVLRSGPRRRASVEHSRLRPSGQRLREAAFARGEGKRCAGTRAGTFSTSLSDLPPTYPSRAEKAGLFSAS
jgi:hypothetical protein